MVMDLDSFDQRVSFLQQYNPQRSTFWMKFEKKTLYSSAGSISGFRFITSYLFAPMQRSGIDIQSRKKFPALVSTDYERKANSIKNCVSVSPSLMYSIHDPKERAPNPSPFPPSHPLPLNPHSIPFHSKKYPSLDRPSKLPPPFYPSCAHRIYNLRGATPELPKSKNWQIEAAHSHLE